MRAWQAPRYGEFEKVLCLEPSTVFKPEGSFAVMRVKAVGLNYLDILSIGGSYQEKAPLPFIPCIEAAGEVIATTPDAAFKVGDKVMTVGKAACAEYMVVQPDATFLMPDNMSFCRCRCLSIDLPDCPCGAGASCQAESRGSFSLCMPGPVVWARRLFKLAVHWVPGLLPPPGVMKS